SVAGRVFSPRAALPPVAAASGPGLAVSSLAAPAVFIAVWLAAAAACVGCLAVRRIVPAAIALLLGVVAAGGLRGEDVPLPPDHVRDLGLPRALRVEALLVTGPRRSPPPRARLRLGTERASNASVSGLAPPTPYAV